jgi:hypothetical protein
VTIEQLAKLGHEMRERQKSYFRTKNSITLAECKELEKRFDAAVELILKPDSRDLFNQGE